MTFVHGQNFPESQETILVGIEAVEVSPSVPFGAAELVVSIFIGMPEIPSDATAYPGLKFIFLAAVAVAFAATRTTRD